MAQLTARRLAEYLSFVLSPPVLASFAFLLLLTDHVTTSIFLNLFVAVLFGTLIPLAVLYSLAKLKITSAMDVSERSQRTVPFLAVILSYTLGAVILLITNAPEIVAALMLCYAGNSLFMMLTNFWWKISIHASGIAGPATVLTYNFGLTMSLFFLLLVPVGWARTQLRIHTLAEISAGAILTVITTLLQLLVYRTIL